MCEMRGGARSPAEKRPAHPGSAELHSSPPAPVGVCRRCCRARRARRDQERRLQARGAFVGENHNRAGHGEDSETWSPTQEVSKWASLCSHLASSSSSSSSSWMDVFLSPADAQRRDGPRRTAMCAVLREKQKKRGFFYERRGRRRAGGAAEAKERKVTEGNNTDMERR